MRILYIALALTAAVAAASDDPAGWSKAHWGMTDGQILQAFAGEAVRLDPPDPVNHARVHIPDAEVAGHRFHVYFVPGKDGALSSVLLDSLEKSPSSILFDTLQQALVARYGRPWDTHSGELIYFDESQWTTPTTVISLTFIHSDLSPIATLTIQYRRKPDDKL